MGLVSAAQDWNPELPVPLAAAAGRHPGTTAEAKERMSAELDARFVVNKLKLGICRHSIFDNDLVRVDQQNATPLARHWRILFSHSKVAPKRQHRSDIAYAASHPRWDQITALMK